MQFMLAMPGRSVKIASRVERRGQITDPITDEIVEAAEKAYHKSFLGAGKRNPIRAALEAALPLIASQERGACARVAEEWGQYTAPYSSDPRYIAAAIRARGKGPADG